MSTCPCGSATDYAACCETIIKGVRPAATAEQLMRARYAAYAMTEMDFIFASTHPDHRQGYDHEGTRTWAENSEWLGLTILNTVKGTAQDSAGEVEFIARFREKGGSQDHEHHEHGQFVKQDGNWYFTDGVMAKAKPLVSAKIGRNEPCPCGSGHKFKKCCGK